jgi:hypothetical protein
VPEFSQPTLQQGFVCFESNFIHATVSCSKVSALKTDEEIENLMWAQLSLSEQGSKT